MSGLKPVAQGYLTWDRESENIHQAIFMYLKCTPVEENVEAKLGPVGRHQERQISNQYQSPLSPHRKKLVHEVVSSLPEDTIKQTDDYLVGCDRGNSSVGYSNGFWPVVDTTTSASQSTQSGSIQKSVGFWKGGESFIGQFGIVLGALLPSGSPDF